MEEGEDGDHIELFYITGRTAAFTKREKERYMKVLGRGVTGSGLHF